MSNIDWSKLITAQMKRDQLAADLRARSGVIEDGWRVTEMAEIADQLIAIEDDADDALPGTEAQWRAYRTKVRNWKEGSESFPDAAQRPIRPS